MKRKKRKEKRAEGNHPQNDEFFEGKIGSGFMSTLEGQPHEDEEMVEKVGAETPEEREKKKE